MLVDKQACFEQYHCRKIHSTLEEIIIQHYLT